MQIYLSYAQSDEKLADQLAKGLVQQGFSVWDDHEILPGDNWGSKVGEALQKSDAMVVLMTPSSLDSSRSATTYHTLSETGLQRSFDSGRRSRTNSRQNAVDTKDSYLCAPGKA